jgi:hypothetical protein
MTSMLRARGIAVYVATASSSSHTNWYPEEANSDPTLENSGKSLIGNAESEVDRVLELATPPSNVERRGWAAITALQRASYIRRFHIAGDDRMMKWYNRNDTRREHVRNEIIEWLAFIGSQSPFYGWQNDYMARAKRQAWDMSAVQKQIDEVRPSLIVATSCVMWVEEPYLMLARDQGIPTLGCIQSFDNLSSRSFIPDCDYYSLWNQRMQDQLVEYYPERATRNMNILGTPQFDFHVRPEFRWSREETLSKFGLKPGERYILYAANSYHQTPSEPLLIEEFARRCSEVPELKDHRIVVRFHPQDNFNRWDRLKANNRIVLSQPSEASYTFTSAKDQMLLVSSLAHADVSINMWSTMSLDSAAVDTPVVCIAFAGEPGGAEDRFCRGVYATQFYVPIIASGGVRLTNNINELVAEITAYVKDRSRDQSQRKKLVEAEIGPVDGHAAERIADLITTITETDVAKAVKRA